MLTFKRCEHQCTPFPFKVVLRTFCLHWYQQSALCCSLWCCWYAILRYLSCSCFDFFTFGPRTPIYALAMGAVPIPGILSAIASPSAPAAVLGRKQVTPKPTLCCTQHVPAQASWVCWLWGIMHTWGLGQLLPIPPVDMHPWADVVRSPSAQALLCSGCSTRPCWCWLGHQSNLPGFIHLHAFALRLKYSLTARSVPS